MSESVLIHPFFDDAKNAEEACRNRQNEDIRVELSRVLKNIADSNGQLAEAGKSLSILAENLNDVADPPDQVGRIVVAFVRKLLGEVRIPGEHNSTDSDSLRLLEFSHLFEHARVLCEKDEPPTQNVLSTEASDEDVLLWLGVLDKKVSSRNELISEYVDFIASVFRSLQEEGAWDKRTSLGNEKRLLEIASTYEARKRALKERERIEQERVEREAKEKAAAELAAQKQEMDGLFGAAEIQVNQYQPKTSVKKRLNVLNSEGFMQVVGMWWAQHGCTLSVAELEKIFSKQLTYCNKLANDKEHPIFIQSEHIEYVDDVKAK